MKDKRTPRLAPSRRDAMETRSRLLMEAGKAFARLGFEGAGLRDICSAAGANLGAVKYYFGSKKALYRETLIEPHLQLLQEEPVPVFDERILPEQALKQWIEFFMKTILVRRREHPYLSRLFIREFVTPTFALEELIQLVFIHVRYELIKIIAAILGRKTHDAHIEELANMVILLCVQHELGRAVLERIDCPPPEKESEVLALADRIHMFALAGIKGMP